MGLKNMIAILLKTKPGKPTVVPRQCETIVFEICRACVFIVVVYISLINFQKCVCVCVCFVFVIDFGRIWEST